MQSLRIRFVIIAAAVYLVDRLTKWWVLAALADGQPVDVLGSVVRLRLLHNSGAAFSMGSDVTWLFTLLSAAMSVAILYALRRLREPRWGLALGALLGGALGNLTDRLLRPPGFGVGEVVDFISISRFAIFNVADSAIVLSCVAMFLLSLRGIEYDKDPRNV